MQYYMARILTENTATTPQPKPPRLLDRVRDEIRLRHFALSTEKTYVHWTRRFVLFHGKRHPRDMGVTEIGAFLTHLAVAQHVSAST